MRARVWFLATACTGLVVADLALGPVLVTADGAGPDLLLPLAVYVALAAPWSVSPFFYWGLGTFSDLFAVPRPGLRGLTYLLAALALERLNPGRRRRNPLVHGLLALGAALGVELVYMLAAQMSWPAGLGAAAAVALKSALLTGGAALLVAGALGLMARLFGWPPPGGPLSRSQLMAAAAAGARRTPRRRKKG